jgi:type VI secretion system secreted protein Hcp
MADADFFLKLEGVDGESEDSKHKNEIEILSFSFGASNTGTSAKGTGAGAGKVNLQDFSFVKTFDKASSNLFKRCANGEHIPSATLVCRKPTGMGGQQEYLTIKFTYLMVTQYSCGGSGGHDPIPTESISLNFQKIEFDYKPQKSDGTLGGSVLASWDTKENKAT